MARKQKYFKDPAQIFSRPRSRLGRIFSKSQDLVKLQKNAILVPTPGQTEQEYLAQSLSKSNYFQFQNQKEFSLSTAQIQSNNFVVMNYQDYITNWNDILKIFKK